MSHLRVTKGFDCVPGGIFRWDWDSVLWDCKAKPLCSPCSERAYPMGQWFYNCSVYGNLRDKVENVSVVILSLTCFLNKVSKIRMTPGINCFCTLTAFGPCCPECVCRPSERSFSMFFWGRTSVSQGLFPVFSLCSFLLSSIFQKWGRS